MTQEIFESTPLVKRGLAEMLKGGVIMDVVNAEQAKIAEPPNAKITALVCSGRSLPYDSQEIPAVRSGQRSCAAIITPIRNPTIPHTTVMMVNCRTTVSL